MEKLRVGIVGCGKISDIYLTNLTGMFSGEIEAAALCDADPERAAAQSRKYGVPCVRTADELMALPDVELVLNLTTPKVHYKICSAAIAAKKHVYTEKPLSQTYAEGAALIEEAIQAGCLVGSAPDTFLGAGLQTCRGLIDNGLIGKPLSATAFMTCHGWEAMHENPDFYFQRGGGPMFDMGPYYLTALVSMLGSAAEVSSMTSQAFERRVIGTGARKGQQIEVEVPTHITGTLRFESGVIATVLMTFDVWDTPLPYIQIFGTKGTLLVPDPNTFGGPVLLRRMESDVPEEVPLIAGYAENSRGLGLLDFARSLRKGSIPRADGRMALHVLEIMEAFHRSADERQFVPLESRVIRPDMLY